MYEAEWDAARKRLTSERASARRRLVFAKSALAARAKDPLGLKEAVQKHPFLVPGIAAGAGALLARMMFGGGGGRSSRDDDEPRHRERGGFGAAFRNMAMGVATPYITRFLTEKLQDFLEARAEARREEDVPAP